MRTYAKIQYLFILFTLFIGSATAAEMQEYSVKLHSLKAIQQPEKPNHELYISVTEFPQGKHPSHYQIPSFPSHWLSKYLDHVHDVVLWQRPLQQCENTDVVFSVVEEYYQPWNADDLLGSVRLKIKCENGKMSTQWDIPNKSITTQLKDKENVFNFIGNHANYEAEFLLNHVKTTQVPNNASEQGSAPSLQDHYLLIP